MELADALECPSEPKGEFENSAEDAGGYRPRTLRAELKRRGAFPAGEVVAIGLKLAAALDHLHQNGLVHRDVKPSNILFIDGEPKLADAGLVAPMDDARSLVGTAGYIAPEGPGTPRADVFALGKVLYELAFGKDRLEFPALPPDLAGRADHLDLIEINEIIAKACAHDPRERYETAAAMRAELEALRGGGSVRRRRASARGWKLAFRLAVVTAVISSIWGGFVLMRRQVRGSTKAPISLDSKAVVLYKQAKGMINQWRPDVALLAYEYLAKAVQLEPEFLDAYYMMFEGYFSPIELPPYTNRMANFKWVAEQMRKLNPNSAQYHTAVAFIKGEEWKWDEEIEHLKLALKADDQFVRAHGLYGGVLLRARADPEGALREFRAAEGGEAFDSIIQKHLGTPYYAMGDYTNAIDQFKKAIKLGLQSGAQEFLALAYEANGQYLEALEADENAQKEQPDADQAGIRSEFEEYKTILLGQGVEAMWKARLRNLERYSTDFYAIAGLYARLGKKSQALDYLDKAFDDHSGAMPELLVDHFWRPLYGDKRFQEMVTRMGFTMPRSRLIWRAP